MNDAKTSPGAVQPEPAEAALDSATAPRAADTDTDIDPAVVFTAADVTARPPDHTPTEAAPASEKAALLFERS